MLHLIFAERAHLSLFFFLLLAVLAGLALIHLATASDSSGRDGAGVASEPTTISSQTSTTAQIVQRKYFHLLSLVLFLPVSSGSIRLHLLSCFSFCLQIFFFFVSCSLTK